MGQQLKGEVEIYKLAQQVQDVLHIHNNPGNSSSYYEEMVSRQQQEKLQVEIQKKQEEDKEERQVLGAQSRTLNDFEVIKELGSGGFGRVLKVRNKLDDRIYALKEIVLYPEDTESNSKILREAKLLSKLNHKNVVRYYNSWFDSAIPDNCIPRFPSMHDVESNISYQPRASDRQISSRHLPETNKNDTIIDPNNIPVMCIQMALCERMTLKTAIDNELWREEERVWRLFREIVEGLAYIHQKKIIHRDLKPLNIFLDGCDHVKIGDFGLATTNILPTSAQTMNNELQSIGTGSDIGRDDRSTREVGTFYYNAPELITTAEPNYDHKVDIYSLGIILFEMCHKPFKTGMERAIVLENLRSQAIKLPPEFTDVDMPHQVHLLKQLLDHVPSHRPTAQKLLNSEYLPPPQLEEAEIREMVRQTLSNRQSESCKYLIKCCLEQKMTPAEDITYDSNLSYSRLTSCPSPKVQFLQENVRSKVIEVFQRHGGVWLESPLLMLKSSQSHNNSDSGIKLMTSTGSVVSLPHDLRASFARYVVRNNITHLKRYAIERVYSEKVQGFQPRELYECAFDIISPTPGGLMDEAELISIVGEIANEIPELRGGAENFSVRLNHTSLLQALLMYLGNETKNYCDIYTRNGKILTPEELWAHLNLLQPKPEIPGDDEEAKSRLLHLLNKTEISLDDALGIIIDSNGKAASLAKEGLNKLKIVIDNAEALGIKWPMLVVPLLAHDSQQDSGVIYQITYKSAVIAAGSRYNEILTSFCQFLEPTKMSSNVLPQFGVRISISLDKLVCAVRENSEESAANKFGVDVAVCCIGDLARREKGKAEILRHLWSKGWKVISLGLHSYEEICKYCRETSINYIVILDGDSGTSCVQSWEEDRYQEKEIRIEDIVNFFQSKNRQSAFTSS